MGQRAGQQQVKVRTDATFDTLSCWKLRVVHKMSYQQIADHFSTPEKPVSAQAVWQRIKRLHNLLPDPDTAAAFAETERYILDSVRQRALANMLSPGKLEGASARDLAVIHGIAFDKMRLLRGQSTSNIGLHTSIILDAWGGQRKAEDEPHREPHREIANPATTKKTTDA